MYFIHIIGSEGRAERFQSDHVVFQELCAFLKSDAMISDDWFPGAERYHNCELISVSQINF